MRIAHLTYDLSPGGAERLVVDIASAQCDAGNDVTIVCLNNLENGAGNHYANEISKGVHLISLGFSGKLSIKSLIGVGQFFKNSSFDIVNAHTFPIVVYPIALFSNTRLVLTYHSIASYYILNPFFTLIDKCLFKKKRVIPVTISPVCHDSFRKAYGINYDILIPNGRSAMKVSALAEQVKEEIRDYNPNGNPVFIHIARFSKEKNQTMLVDAFKQLYDEGIPFCLLMVGPDYPADFISETEKCPYIHCLGQKHNIADYLACSQYFVLSSTFEGLPISLLEAMSMGCIPVSTPAGGVKNVISNDVTGYLSEDFSSDGLANTISRALNIAPVSRDAVIKEYESNYTISVCMNRYLNLYKQTK